MLDFLYEHISAFLSKLTTSRRAGIAMMFALSMPMLLVVTGLSVDVGYWYQNQTALQSAADAAAMAAAMNDSRLGQSTNDSKRQAALPYAKSMADAATNQQFGFVSGTPGTSLTLAANIGSAQTVNSASVTTTTYTATASAPRPAFFSSVSGPGFQGLSAGTQSASATASLLTTTSNSSGGCLITLGTTGTDIYLTGGAKIDASGCTGTGIVSNSTSSCNSSTGTGSISVNPSATIVTSSVESAGCVYVNTNGGAKIVNASGGGASYSTGSGADPYATLAAAGFPKWPSQPSQPSLSNTVATSAFSLGYVKSYSYAYAGCSPDYAAQCWLYPYEFSGALNPNVVSLELRDGSDASSYDSTYVFTSGFKTSNGTLTFDSTSSIPATYYFQGATSTKKNVTTLSGYGLELSSPTITWGKGGVYYFNGGWAVDGSSPTMTVGTSTMLSTAYSGASNGATYLQEGNITFGGGTYYFDGGLVIGGSGNVTFGPGIYYIVNGPFSVTNGGTLTANGATFVLEGTSYYAFNGGTNLTLSAPVANSATNPTNCVLPFSSGSTTGTPYPQTTYAIDNTLVTATPTYGTPITTNAGSGYPGKPYPWDGTNGKGICGVLIYQTPTDSSTDYITEGTTNTVNGIIYTPAAALTMSGAGSMKAGTNSDGTAGTLAIISNSISLTGSANLTLSTGSSTSNYGLSSSTTTSQILLTN